MSYADKLKGVFTLVYNEITAVDDQPFFRTEDGLDACARKNTWTVDTFKEKILGLQPMGKHSFIVRCKGEKERDEFLKCTPNVLISGNREFLGGQADARLEPSIIRVRIQDLLPEVPDDLVIAKLRKYGKVEKNTELEKIRSGKLKDFENGTRVFYMSDLSDKELGLPPSFYVKGHRVRIHHAGQIKGKERWEAEEKRREATVNNNTPKRMFEEKQHIMMYH